MSLHNAAKHLAAHGRGDDKVLVHMTKGEVKSLNDLAMAGGGQLTINPHTGLPEAGFLSAMLPMMLGAGLAAATGGSSLLIGAGIGGLQAARTGSISKGLMAGLGAFGGAGLASGLATAGNAAASQAASAANPAFMGPMPGAASGLSAVQAGVTGLGTEAGRTAALGAMGGGAGAAKLGLMAAAPAIAGDPKTPTMATPDKDMGQRYSFTGNQPQATPAPDVPTYEDMLTKQGNFGSQQNYFATPTYTPINPTAAKDLYHFADGGPVEQMSNQAAMGANTMYPMANTATSSFATPYQAPQSTNMLANMAPSGGGAVNMMSGEPSMQGTRMAGGGISGNIDFGAPQSQNAGPLEQLIRMIHAKQTGGGPMEEAKKYEYNPEQQQYVQMAGGGIPSYRIGGDLNIQDAPDGQPVGPLGRLLGMAKKREQDTNPGLGYTYNPEQQQYVQQQAGGGLSDAGYNLGGYSDGGRLLRGPGDGVSDSIPATIGNKQPARLADGEFVIPARIVSELGNGSTEAGARKLYAMMDRVQASRKKTVGKNKVAHNNKAEKYLPA